MSSEIIGTLGPPHAHGLEPPAEELRLAAARRRGWPKLSFDALVFHRYSVVEDTSTGRLYQLHRGELVDALYVGAVAYFEDASGAIRFLEHAPPGAPQTRAELEQRQAEHRQPPNAPKPRRQATRR